MSWKCPECNDEIDRLNYSVDTREHGESHLIDNPTARELVERNDLIHENNSEESNWEGEVEYACPECGATLSIMDLIFEGEPRSEPPRTNRRNRYPTNPLEEPDTIHRSDLVIQDEETENTEDFTIVCMNSECKKPFIFTLLDRYQIDPNPQKCYECPHCLHLNNLKDYKEQNKTIKSILKRKTREDFFFHYSNTEHTITRRNTEQLYNDYTRALDNQLRSPLGIPL